MIFVKGGVLLESCHSASVYLHNKYEKRPLWISDLGRKKKINRERELDGTITLQFLS